MYSNTFSCSWSCQRIPSSNTPSTRPISPAPPSESCSEICGGKYERTGGTPRPYQPLGDADGEVRKGHLVRLLHAHRRHYRSRPKVPHDKQRLNHHQNDAEDVEGDREPGRLHSSPLQSQRIHAGSPIMTDGRWLS